MTTPLKAKTMVLVGTMLLGISALISTCLLIVKFKHRSGKLKETVSTTNLKKL